MDVEGLAVTYVSDRLRRCPHLQAQIDIGDKTPSTDGHIIIYSDKRKRKSDSPRRIYVQVKGVTFKEGTTRPSGTFRISRADLKTYLELSGCLFFVVTMTKSGRKRKAHYVLLNPFRIHEILSEMKPTQKSVAVELEKFPTDPDKIEGVIQLATTMKKQQPDLGFDPSVLNNLSEISIHSLKKIDFSRPQELDGVSGKFAVFMKSHSGAITPLPGLFSITPQEYVGEPLSGSFSSNGVTFSDPIRQRIDADTIELHLSAGLTFRLTKQPKGLSGQVKITASDNLEERYQDLKFYLGCLENQTITIDGTPTAFEGTADSNSEEFVEHYHFLERVMILLEVLGIDAGLISMDMLDDKRTRQLAVLNKALVEGQEVEGDYESAGRLLQPIGPYNIQLLCVPGEAANTWRILDVFKVGELRNHKVWVGSPEGMPSTPYDMLNDEELGKCLNLHIDQLVQWYEDLEPVSTTFSFANMTVLRLIAAADSAEERADELLSAANKLNEWLIKEDGERTHHIVNRLQIIARGGLLSPEERSQARRLRNESFALPGNTGNNVAASCSILLGQMEEAEDALQRMSAEDQELFKTWPIWHLSKNGYQDKMNQVNTSALPSS